MGAWQIPLSGPRPQGNAFDATMKGSQDALNAQSMMQQQDLRTQQIQGTQLDNEQKRLQVAEMNRQNQEQGLLSKAYLDAHGDMHQFFSNAAQAGVRPGTLAPLQKSWVDGQEALVKLGETQNKALTERHDALNGNLMGTFSTVGDDGMRKWRAPTAEEWPRWITSARNSHMLSPEELEGVVTAHPLDQPPTAEQMQQYSAGLYTMTQANKAALDTIANRQKAALTTKDLVEADKTRAEIPGVTAGSEQKVRGNWASQLAAASTPEQYGSILDQMPHGLAQRVPVAREDFDPDESPAVLQRWGQTSEEQVKSDLASATLEARKGHYGAIEQNAQQRTDLEGKRIGLEGARVGLEGQRVDLQRQRMEVGDDGQTPNSRAIDRRAAEKEIPQLELREAQLNRDRRSLGQAIKSGTALVKDKNGNDVDPRELLEDKSQELKSVLSSKYDAYHRAGRGAPSVSLEDAHRAVDSGMQPKGTNAASPQQKQQQQQKPQAQQPKFTEQEIRRRATAAGRDPDFAVKSAREKGLL